MINILLTVMYTTHYIISGMANSMLLEGQFLET